MNSLDQLVEAFLIEAALTKGSQRVLADKKLVAGLADAMRDDVQSNPSAFPPGSKVTFKKADDQVLAEWFLENIDRIEREGYEGTVYSRDGVNSDWIVRRYIAGSHSWEDLTGVMNMNLRDWYLLKNRNLLDANHKDLPKFNSVRDVGHYMTTHYKGELDKVRDAAKNAARNKMSKSIKLVDNDDYRIYAALNRPAACALGLGTQWCTANSTYAGHYHTYANKAMLFQVFPYVEKKNPETGEDELSLNDNEKYQFDAGGPNFMNITDRPVSADAVSQRFPYLYSDLVAGLRANKGKIEKIVKDSEEDPLLQGPDLAVKKYDVDAEIAKLDKLKDKGFFTDEVRPRKQQADAPVGDQPQIGAEPTAQQPPQEQQMESIRDLARAMLEDVTLGHIVQSFKPHNQAGGESPLTHGDENLDEEEFDECAGLDSAKQRLAQALGKGMDEDAPMPDDAGADIGGQVATGGGGSMGAGVGGGGQYPTGTAPTMPESINNKGNNVMENVDKDVAAMLTSLKKYDKLNESVLGMTTMSMKAPVEEMYSYKTKGDGKPKDILGKRGGGMKNPVAKDPEGYKNMRKGQGANPTADQKKYGDMYPLGGPKKGSYLPEDDMEEGNEFSGKLAKAKAEHKSSFKIGGKEVPVKEAGPAKHEVPAAFRKEKGGDWKTSKADLEKDANKSPTTKKGLEDLKAKKDIKETADPEVLEWMSRFSKLGNMKGYGR